MMMREQGNYCANCKKFVLPSAYLIGLIGPRGKSMSSDFQNTMKNADFYDECNDVSISLTGTEVIDNLMERRTYEVPKWNQSELQSPANPLLCCDIISAISFAKFVEGDLFR
jgi:hypothetical protein